ncbi:membrane transporter [Schizosaccharomyces cryophilus OY26]|uniref:Membrane transporter n=1 Tax=Schizosaccharomyces cryophilus (strain OY26 / ATCC MYA-4695 / CBS 11777 / NBRC 106824 / NRRL Y48691) TaxID=653667 RepID=S9VZH1_SCHCR|nr:membrane transporter [Schizosaccharomyces cryophilus OY26]EPY51589.1 membrane transporter [Schizosaccharomyces cryophilus OY26]
MSLPVENPNQKDGTFGISRRRSRIEHRPTEFLNELRPEIESIREEYESNHDIKEKNEYYISSNELDNSGAPSFADVSNDSKIDNANMIPPKRSIALILVNSIMSDMSFGVALPTSPSYTEKLGGTDAFSGLVVGIPTLISLLMLYPMLKLATPKSAKGYTLYYRPMLVSVFAHSIGHLLYCMADQANWLYLILIGRMMNGIGFTMFLYHKKYTTDKLLVGPNRRTFLATLNILAQTLGFMAGPFLGGILAKGTKNLENRVWNQYTGGSWFMMYIWIIFGVFLVIFYKEVYPQDDRTVLEKPVDVEENTGPLSLKHIYLLSFLGLAAFVSYFNISGYQTSIPIYANNLYNYNAYQSGNFISLAALVISPFVFLSTFLSRWLEDRHIMLIGFMIGIIALVLHLVLDALHRIPVQAYFVFFSIMMFGFSIGSAPLVSLASKQMKPKYHVLSSVLFQVGLSLSNTVGAICGGAIYSMTTVGFIGLCIGLSVVAFLQSLTLWNSMKLKLH